MATSGTTTFSVNVQTVIEDALQNIGVLGVGGSLKAEDSDLAMRKMNLLVKQWVGQADFAPGLKLWTRRRGYLFLQNGQSVYDIGPSGDAAADESYVSTTLAAAASGGAFGLTLASAAGIASGDNIGVLLSSGDIDWTTVSGAPSGATVALTAALASGAALGARVFTYTNSMRKPFEAVSAVRRDVDGNDEPMDPWMSGEEYEVIGNKSSEGNPSRLYLEARRAVSRVFLDCAPSDVTDVIRMVYLSYIEDFGALDEDVDLPAEWFRPLSAQLSIDLCPAYAKAVTPELKLMRDESLAIARNAYPQKSTAAFCSEPDDY